MTEINYQSKVWDHTVEDLWAEQTGISCHTKCFEKLFRIDSNLKLISKPSTVDFSRSLSRPPSYHFIICLLIRDARQGRSSKVTFDSAICHLVCCRFGFMFWIDLQMRNFVILKIPKEMVLVVI